MDSVALKSALRKDLLAQRNALGDEWVQEASAQIFHKWRNRFSMRHVTWLHLFQTMEQRKEVETKPFFDYLRNKHPRIHLVIPIVDQFHGVLRHAHIPEDIEMVKNRWGILEPKLPMEFIPPMMLDMVLVPLLGFDMKGNRIGYGKGYYDRFLSLVRPTCLKIGVGYECQKVVDGLPIEAHDTPLDFVITEKAVYRLNETLTI